MVVKARLFILGTMAAVLSCFSDMTPQDGEPLEASGGKSERQWCEHIAVEEFGCSSVDGKVEGVEVTLFNGRRVDLLWGQYAIEFDWAEKVFEGCGQCLYYAAVTERRPGLVLLVKDREDHDEVRDAIIVARSVDPSIRVWAYDVDRKKMLRVSDTPDVK